MPGIKILKILNPVMFVVFLTAAVTVVLYKYPVIEPLHGSSVLYEIHATAGLIFIALGILHIVLNWKWIQSQIFGNKPSKKTSQK